MSRSVAQWWRTRGCWYLFFIAVAAGVLFHIAHSLPPLLTYSQAAMQHRYLWLWSSQLLVRELTTVAWLLLASEIQVQWRRLSEPGPAVETMLAARFLYTLAKGWPILVVSIGLPILLTVLEGTVFFHPSPGVLFDSISGWLRSSANQLPQVVWFVGFMAISSRGRRLAWFLYWAWLGSMILGYILPPIQNRPGMMPNFYFWFPLDWLLGVSIFLCLFRALRTKNAFQTNLIAGLLFAAIATSNFLFRWNLESGSALSTTLQTICNHLFLAFGSIPVDVRDSQSWWLEHFPKHTTLLWYLAPAMPILVLPLTMVVLIPLIGWFLNRLELQEERLSGNAEPQLVGQPQPTT